MDHEIKKLRGLNKKLKSLDKKRDKLITKKHKIHKKVSELERAEITKERDRFFDNIQISKIPFLVSHKRRALVDNLRETDLLRDQIFHLEDVFKLIVAYLGPMEYFIFSRVNKQLVGLLTNVFHPWTRQLIDRIKQEDGSQSFIMMDTKVIPLVNLVCEHQFAKKEDFIHRLLHLLYAVFVAYRPQRLLQEINITKSTTLREQMKRTTVFVANGMRDKITRMSDHNLLCGRANYTLFANNIRYHFKQKYGFEMLSTSNGLDYFRYDDLNALNLHRPQHKSKAHHEGLFFITLGEKGNEIIPLEDSGMAIYTMKLPIGYAEKRWQGYYFCDEYECRLQLLNALEPPSSISGLMKEIETLVLSL